MEELNKMTVDELKNLIEEAKEQISLKTKKTKLERADLIFDEHSIIKYATQVPNIFIYECEGYCGYPRSIMSNERNKMDDFYGERAVILEYDSLVNGKLCGIPDIIWDYGLDEKYEL